MSAQETVRVYFEALRQGAGWQACLSDGLAFTSFTSPPKRLVGKEAFLQGTERFYSSIAAVEVCELLVDGNRACARTRYRLKTPVGAPFTSDVAELFTVRDGKIEALEIYFDTAPFPT